MAYSRTRVREKYHPKAEKLVDQIREVMRFHHYAYRTEQTYVDWIVRFIKFHGTTHPRELEHADIEKYLSHLAQEQGVAASTQNQAQNRGQVFRGCCPNRDLSTSLEMTSV